MPQFRLPLAAAYNSRINENASTTKDGRMLNCFPITVSDPITGKRKIVTVKRPGWGTQSTLSAGNIGTAIMTWTGQGSGQKVIAAFGATNSTIYDTAIGNGLFVAVSYDGTGDGIMTSTDGVTWTTRVPPDDNAWTSVTYGGGLFVAVGVAGADASHLVMTSIDGITWTERTQAASTGFFWHGVAYGNGVFVAVGNAQVMTSSDGATWTKRTCPSSESFVGVAYGNGLFVAVSAVEIMTSPDGITWTVRTGQGTAITYGNGLFVATYSSTGLSTSPDGITWTSRSMAAANTWRDVTYGNGLFVAVSSSGTGNRVMTSPDGITWTSRTSAADVSWESVTYGNGLFVAVAISGTGNRVMTSPDGIVWTSRTSAADNLWQEVTYGNTVTNYGAITGYSTGITETILSGQATLLISSSDNTAWNTSSDAVTGALTFTGDTHTNTTIDGISSTTGLVVGQLLTGSGIAANTRIASIDSASAITTDTATTATASGVTITRAILGKVIDTDFPGNASLTLAGTFAHIDGFAIVMTTNGKLWASDLNSVTGWSAAAFDSASSYPDKGIGCIRHRNFIMAFGANSVEFWYNAGLTPFPLARNSSMTQKVGGISAVAIGQIADTVFWCGSTTEGGLSIFSYDSGINRISTPEIDGQLIIAGTTAISLTTIRYYGRSFVKVIAGTRTHCYCIEEKTWFEVPMTTNLDYKCTGVSIGGSLFNYAISKDSTAGKLYVMDHSALTFVDDGTAYTAKVQLQTDDHGTSDPKFYSSARLIGDQSPVASSATLTYSDDDYQSEVTAGTFDLTTKNPRLNRLGRSEGRAWSVSHSTNCAWRAEALEVEFEVGT